MEMEMWRKTAEIQKSLGGVLKFRLQYIKRDGAI